MKNSYDIKYLYYYADCNYNFSMFSIYSGPIYSLYTHTHTRIYIIRVFCPKAGPSLQNQTPRLQFCLKGGLALQTQEPRLQFY